MLIIDEDSYKIQFYSIDIDSEVKSKYQELEFVKGECNNIIVSQDISEDFYTIQSTSKSSIVIALTNNDMSRIYLLHQSESSWYQGCYFQI